MRKVKTKNRILANNNRKKSIIAYSFLLFLLNINFVNKTLDFIDLVFIFWIFMI